MAAIVIEVPCSGSVHRVELRGDGTAEMLDHDELVVRAFVAFNAEPPECLAALDKAREDPVAFVFQHAEMDDKVKGLLACDFAQCVLPLFEASYPDDDRPRKAIEVTRAYWRGKATLSQVAAAGGAAARAAMAAAAEAYVAAANRAAAHAATAEADAARAAMAAAAEAEDAASAAMARAAAWAAPLRPRPGRTAAPTAATATWAVYHNAKAQSLDDQAALAAKAAEQRWQLGRIVKVLDAVQRGKRWPRLS